MKEGSGNSTQICSLSLPLCEGRKFSSPLFSFHVCFKLMLPCCCFNVCMFVGMLGSFENHVIFWMFSFHVYVCIFEIFLAWVFWYYSPLERAEVTNFGKGLFSRTPTSVESLLRMRRGRKDRVLWAPTCQHKPCMIMVCRNGRTKVLGI